MKQTTVTSNLDISHRNLCLIPLRQTIERGRHVRPVISCIIHDVGLQVALDPNGIPPIFIWPLFEGRVSTTVLTVCLPVPFLYRFSCEMHIWGVPSHPYDTLRWKINQQQKLLHLTGQALRFLLQSSGLKSVIVLLCC